MTAAIKTAFSHQRQMSGVNASGSYTVKNPKEIIEILDCIHSLRCVPNFSWLLTKLQIAATKFKQQ